MAPGPVLIYLKGCPKNFSGATSGISDKVTITRTDKQQFPGSLLIARILIFRGNVRIGIYLLLRYWPQ